MTTAAVRAAQAPSSDTAAVVASPATGAALRARGIDFGFNLDYPEALAAFRQAIAADPNDATAYRLAAATLWVSLLFQQGAVTVEDFLGQARANVARKPVPGDVAAMFRDYATRAREIAERRVREHPQDPDAHFQVGAAAAFEASYTATVEGHVLAGVGAARRAYREHKRVMELDPRRKDAGLVVGLYRFAVSELPAPLRLLARIAGFGSDRANGLSLVEEAARYPSDVQTNARFTLALIYNRAGRHADALAIIRELQARYPRNRLLYLEAGSTALRAGHPAEALDALDRGLAMCARDTRPRAFGENARWLLYRGTALAQLGRGEAAERDLHAVLEAQGPQWVRGRAHLELGKIASHRGRRPAAISEFRFAATDCRADHDSACVDEAGKLAALR